MIITSGNIPFPTTVALGFFDGVHLGHASIISKAKQLASEGVKSVIYTLDLHPSFLLGSPTAMIAPGESRIKLLESFDTDYIFLQKTDREFLNICPEEFVLDILIKQLGAIHIISGENYTFGKNKSGSSALLKKLCDEKNIKYTILPFSTDKNEIISSSLIRSKLASGDLADANRMLGRLFFLTGTVTSCRKVGKSLGFPTANLLPMENAILPMNGVYATNTIINNRTYPSVTNVGPAPTFSQKKTIIETFILDFNEYIYSKNITVEFIELIRQQQRFENSELLIAQLKRDVSTRRKI